MKLVVLSILLIAASCVTTISYSYSGLSTAPALNNVYPLGNIAASSNLTAVVSLPNGGALSSLSIINSAGVSTSLTLTGNSGTIIVATADTYSLKVVGTTAATGASVSTITLFYLSATINGAAVLKLSDIFRTNFIFK